MIPNTNCQDLTSYASVTSGPDGFVSQNGFAVCESNFIGSSNLRLFATMTLQAHLKDPSYLQLFCAILSVTLAILQYLFNPYCIQCILLNTHWTVLLSIVPYRCVTPLQQCDLLHCCNAHVHPVALQERNTEMSSASGIFSYYCQHLTNFICSIIKNLDIELL